MIGVEEYIFNGENEVVMLLIVVGINVGKFVNNEQGVFGGFFIVVI